MERPRRLATLVALLCGVALHASASDPEVRYTYDSAGNLTAAAVCQIACDESICGRNRTMPDGCGGVLSCPLCTTCDSAHTLCDGECFNLAADQLNCGACGNACQSTETSPGSCVNGVCYTLSSDPNNCGSVGYICPELANAAAACFTGICWSRCNDGYALCDDSCISVASSANLSCMVTGYLDSGFDLVLY